MDRRAFIKLTAVTGTSATLASCGSPENHLIRFVPDDELVPGVAEWKPSVCPSCGAGCGLRVRVMEADVEVTRKGQPGVVKMGVAKKLEGNPAHPVNQGALCPRGQAAIQVTYHPDRIAHPLKRTGARGTGQFREVSWDEALSELLSRLDGLAEANDQQALTFLTRRRHSRRHELAAQFLSRFGAPPPLTFELFGEDVLRRANALSFGRDQLPTFDLARSRYVLAFGPDFLGTWNSPVSQNAGYALMRQGHPGMRGKFVQIESRMSQTGASADEWVPVTPGTACGVGSGAREALRSAAPARCRRSGRRVDRRVDDWIDGLHARARRKADRCLGASGQAAGARARRVASGRGDDRRRAAGPQQRALSGTGGERPQRAPRQHRPTRRRLLHTPAERDDARRGSAGAIDRQRRVG